MELRPNILVGAEAQRKNREVCMMSGVMSTLKTIQGVGDREGGVGEMGSVWAGKAQERAKVIP